MTKHTGSAHDLLQIGPLIREKAKKKQIETLKQNSSVNQKSDERKEVNTAKELAKLANVSHGQEVGISRPSFFVVKTFFYYFRKIDISLTTN